MVSFFECLYMKYKYKKIMKSTIKCKSGKYKYTTDTLCYSSEHLLHMRTSLERRGRTFQQTRYTKYDINRNVCYQDFDKDW